MSSPALVAIVAGPLPPRTGRASRTVADSRPRASLGTTVLAPGSAALAPATPVPATSAIASPTGDRYSMTSAALVISSPRHCLMIVWHPADVSEVIGPGTAMSGRNSSRACRAVFSAPLRWPASTTRVPVASAAMTRLRTRNRSRVAVRRGGHSLATTPWAAIASSRSL
jgi:hypothetical protein